MANEIVERWWWGGVSIKKENKNERRATECRRHPVDDDEDDDGDVRYVIVVHIFQSNARRLRNFVPFFRRYRRPLDDVTLTVANVASKCPRIAEANDVRIGHHSNVCVRVCVCTLSSLSPHHLVRTNRCHIFVRLRV